MSTLLALELFDITGLPFSTRGGQYGATIKAARHDLSIVADLKAEQLAYWLDERRADVTSWAQADFLKGEVAALVEGAQEGVQGGASDGQPEAGARSAYDRVTRSLGRLAEASGYARVVVVGIGSGRIIASSVGGDVGLQPCASSVWRSALRTHDSLISAAERSRLTGVAVVHVSRALRDRHGEPLAVLTLEIPLDDISSRLGNLGQSVKESTDEVVLVDQDRRLLLASGGRRPGSPRPVPLVTHIAALPATFASQGRSGLVEAPDYRGIAVIAAYRSIPLSGTTRWGLVVKRDRSEVLAQVWRRLAYTGGVGLLAALAMAIAVLLAAKSITRPLDALSEAAGRLAEGDLAARAPVVADDEVGRLTETFNAMADEVEQWRDRLEAEVDTRTAELAQTNAQLRAEVDQRRGAEETLSESRGKLLAVFENIRVGIALLSPEMRVLEMNRQLQEWFPDVTAADHPLCYQVYNDPPRDAPCAYCPCVETLQDGKVREAITETPGPQGTRHFRIVASPLRDATGQVVAVIELTDDVTEQVRAERAVRESEERLRAVFESAEEFIFLKGRDLRYIRSNAAVSRLLGRSEAEIVGMTDAELFGQTVAAQMAATDARVLAGEVVREVSERNTGRGPRVLDATKVPLRDCAGSIIGICGIARDVTEQVEAQAQLRRLNRALALRSECNLAIIHATDWRDLLSNVCERIVTSGGHELAWVGYAQENAERTVSVVARAGAGIGYLEEARVSWADTALGHGPTGRAIRTGAVAVCQDISTDPQSAPWRAQATAWGLSSSISLPLSADAAGPGALNTYSVRTNAFSPDEIALLAELAADVSYGVTALRARARLDKATVELRQSEERYRALFASMLNGVAHCRMLFDEEGRPIDWIYLAVNGVFEQMTGLKDIIGKRATEAIPEVRELAPHLFDIYGRVARTGEPERFETYFAPLHRWLEVSAYSSERDHFVVVFDDITVRKKADEALRASEERYRQLFETMQEGFALGELVCDEAGRPRDIRYLEANPAWERMTGLSAADVVGRLVSDVAPGLDPNWVWEYARVAYTGEPARLEVRVPHLGRDYEVYAFRPAPGRLATIFTDVTARKAAEAALRGANLELERRVTARTAELQRTMDELESFSYSVSHDLRAPLRAVSGFSKILLSEHAESLPPQVRHYLGMVDDGATQMAVLIDDLLALSRLGRQPLAKLRVDLRALVARVLADLQLELQNRCVDVCVAALPSCWGDPSLVKQVLANLLSNAVKYSRGREQAKIEVGFRHESDEVVYFVRDNGVGFSMEYAHKLFGVFQRLHRSDEFEGTGVGLAVVQRIVHRHGGRVWADAAVGEGATFYFTLGKEPSHAEGGD